MNATIRIASLVCLVGSISLSPRAEDWPQWGGPSRVGDWNETGVVEKFPEGGLKFDWRVPIHSGYSGPAVAGGRVFALDYQERKGAELEGNERAICLDEATGKILWTREWPVSYRKLMMSYATGPRATPAVDGDRVYLIGSSGIILCLGAKDGEVVWKHDCPEEFKTNLPTWGTASSPLIDGNLAIFVAGADPDGKVMAFDKATGKEVWRSLTSQNEIGYSQPVIHEVGGKRQLMIWHPKALCSLDPATGKVYWEQPYDVPSGMAIIPPTRGGNYLIVSSLYGGAMMMELDAATPTAKMLWKIRGKNEKPEGSQALHSVLTTPIILGDYVYGLCSYGELRCLNAKTGERIWSSDKVGRQGRWGSAFWARNGDRYFMNNDQGDLIIARFTPEAYVEIDRTKLIKPTTSSGFGPRKFYDSVVNWTQPAYANRHIVTRNDEEIVRASLEK